MHGVAKPYSYVIVHEPTQRFYVGARAKNAALGLSFDQDAAYMGSSATLRSAMAETPEGWVKHLIAEHDSIDALQAEESALIKAFFNSPLCLNRSKGSSINKTGNGREQRLARLIATHRATLSV